MRYIVYLVFLLTLCQSKICLTEDVPFIITAEEGESCNMPCFGLFGPELSSLMWRNVDQKKDVLHCRGQMVLDGYEDPMYTNRTRLQDPELLNGDLSLVLKKVMPEDSGIYQCQAVYIDGRTTLTLIKLRVRRVTNVKEVSAFVGEDSELSCFTDKPQKLRTLKWTSRDSNTDRDSFLLVWRGRNVKKEYEDPVYENRVDLVNPQLHSGTLNVILKNVTHQDSATFRCLVYYYDSEKISQFVHLTVRERDSTKNNTDPDPSPRLFRGLISGMVSLGLLLLCVVLAVLIYLLRKKTTQIRKNSRSGETPASNSKACPVLLVEGKPSLEKDEDPEFLRQRSCQKTHSIRSDSSNSSEESTSSGTALLPSLH